MLLPETDLVGFVTADGRPLGIYFRQTLPRISELRSTPVDIWGPRRLRYEGFPTAVQLARLEWFATPEQMADLFTLPGRCPPPPGQRPHAGTRGFRRPRRPDFQPGAGAPARAQPGRPGQRRLGV